MNLALFKTIAGHMLKKHFDLDIEKTHFAIDKVVQREIAYNVHPFEALNELVEEFGHDRIDVFPSMSKTMKLTQADEVEAMIEIGLTRTIAHDPLTCKCGADTTLKFVVMGKQLRACTNPDCRHEFLAEPVSAMGLH